MTDLPVSAAWRHVEARDGFEVVFPSTADVGLLFDGHSAGIEAGQAWAVRYSILLDGDWRTRHAYVVSRSAIGPRRLELERDGAEGWFVNGAPAPLLDGCLDVDLEASAFTNAFPVRRLALAAGESAEAPAAYVRAPGLRVERLEQSYRRIDDDGAHTRYDYASPRFEFEALLVYDEHGFVVDYPGIAERVA